MSETSVAHFYDELADAYHLIHSDWDTSIRRQGSALDALIGQDRVTILDCSCGIGTQAMGLALRGHRVTGSPGPTSVPAPPPAPPVRPPSGT